MTRAVGFINGNWRNRWADTELEQSVRSNDSTILREYQQRFGNEAARQLYAECGNQAEFCVMAARELEGADYREELVDNRPV